MTQQMGNGGATARFSWVSRLGGPSAVGEQTGCDQSRRGFGANKKFNIKLNLEITEVKDGVETPFFDNSLKYSDIGYDGVVAVEAVLIEGLNQLNDAGFSAAVAMGLTDRLQSMGIVQGKLAALQARGAA